MEGTFVFPETSVGVIEASAMRSWHALRIRPHFKVESAQPEQQLLQTSTKQYSDPALY